MKSTSIKRRITYFGFALSLLLSNSLNAQGEPVLQSAKFLNDSGEVNTSSYGIVAIQLEFDRAMDTASIPVVRYGLGSAVDTEIVFGESEWRDDHMWLGTFTVTTDSPVEDGQYIFEVDGAKSADGTPMSATRLNKSLAICRSGQIGLSASALDFGTVRAGGLEVLRLTISNSGCTLLNITNITLPSAFTLTNLPPAFSIGIGTSRELIIAFRPETRKVHDGLMFISSDDRVQSQVSVELLGTAFGPHIEVSETSLDFGNIDIGFTATKRIIISNVPASDPALSRTLNIGNIKINQGVFGNYPEVMLLDVGESKAINITFAPTEFKVYNDFLTITSDDLIRPIRTVVISAESRDEEPPASLSNFRVTQESFEGSTNLDSLPVCWDNPDDPSGIASIWWKFTTTESPPTSANDTTLSGGRILLDSLQTCADLPLAGKLTSGFWYCYLWLADGAGNSGFGNALPTQIAYDITAPAIPELVSRSVPEEVWFGDDAPLELTLSVPVDAHLNVSDVTEIRWKFQSKPASELDYDGRHFVEKIVDGSTSIVVPFTSSSLCGADTLFIWAADALGNASIAELLSVLYRFDICSSTLTSLSASQLDGIKSTNSDALDVCWESPEDSTAISELRWKFSPKPSPPQSPDDTTEVGGRAVLTPGQNCVSLPLLGKLSQGKWYCYAWWVFRNGNDSGYLTPVEISFEYDREPPGKPSIARRSIPQAIWFGSGQAYELSINIPNDSFRGASDVASVRWKFQSSPTSTSDSSGSFTFQNTNAADVSFTVPFDSRALCGQGQLYFWLVDSTGNTSIGELNSTSYLFDICPPQIAFRSSAIERIATVGQVYRDTLTILDDIGVENTRLDYRPGGSPAAVATTSLQRLGDSSSYEFVVPLESVTGRGLELRVVANDSLGNEGFGITGLPACDPNADWFPIRAAIAEGRPTNESGDVLFLKSGEQASSYQLFSIPFELNESSVLQVLEDDLGVYDVKEWRLFDYKPDNVPGARFLEGGNARPFQPGRSYFLVTKQEDIIVDTGPGLSHLTVCPDSLRLAGGWNLIASPYNFPIGVESLSLINSNSPVSLMAYDQGWKSTDVMEPWSGYALFITPNVGSGNVPVYLVMEPIAATTVLSKPGPAFLDLREKEWLIGISAKVGRAKDLENWAGVLYGASSEFDDFERAEPPVIGGYVSVSFRHPEWAHSTSAFATDLRPAENVEQVWNFHLDTNVGNEFVEIDFRFLGDLPQDAEIVLIDESLKLARDLRSAPLYTFRSGESGARRQFKLIVGSSQFASANAGDIDLVPKSFELFQNYPNPFNPTTNIRYNLSEASRVTLVVYDLIGRTVRTLVDLEGQPAGYYNVNWDARNEDGNRVASGVYLYQIRTSLQTISRKMILMK